MRSEARHRFLDVTNTHAELREHLRRSVGYGRRAALEDAVRQIETQHVLVFLGPEGCEQARLAHSIHRASTRWEREFVTIDRRTVLGASAERALLSQAHQGTVFVDVAKLDPPARTRGTLLGPALVRGLLGWYRALDVRAIFSASDAGQLARIIGGAAYGDAIRVSAVATRPREVPQIVQSMLAEFGSGHRLDDLDSGLGKRMHLGRWTRNLESLRNHIALLDRYLTNGSVRSAARAIGCSVSSAHEQLARVYGIGSVGKQRRRS